MYVAVGLTLLLQRRLWAWKSPRFWSGADSEQECRLVDNFWLAAAWSSGYGAPLRPCGPGFDPRCGHVIFWPLSARLRALLLRRAAWLGLLRPLSLLARCRFARETLDALRGRSGSLRGRGTTQ